MFLKNRFDLVST